ncbi:MAG: hypothetical protein KDD99_18595 [Bacteroidetes bacterium]|nr:hypothetical protein [Bacteroidota bacterium]
MSHFINQLLSRHSSDESQVKPRLRGRFEPVDGSSLDGKIGEEIPEVEDVQSIEGKKENQSFNQERNEVSKLWTKSIQPLQEKKTSPIKSEINFPQNIREPLHPVPPEQKTLSDDKPVSKVEPSPQKSNLNPTIQPQEKYSEKKEEEFSSFLPKENVSIVAINPNNQEISNSSVQEANTPKSYVQKKGKENPQKFPRLDKKELVKPAIKLRENKSDLSSLLEKVKPTSENRKEDTQTTVIKVTIGRIEVKAPNNQAATPRTIRPVSQPKPQMSLEDYLNQRNNY